MASFFTAKSSFAFSWFQAFSCWSSSFRVSFSARVASYFFLVSTNLSSNRYILQHHNPMDGKMTWMRLKTGENLHAHTARLFELPDLSNVKWQTWMATKTLYTVYLPYTTKLMHLTLSWKNWFHNCNQVSDAIMLMLGGMVAPWHSPAPGRIGPVSGEGKYLEWYSMFGQWPLETTCSSLRLGIWNNVLTAKIKLWVLDSAEAAAQWWAGFSMNHGNVAMLDNSPIFKCLFTCPVVFSSVQLASHGGGQ